jgi:hypothetical protein
MIGLNEKARKEEKLEKGKVVGFWHIFVIFW